MKRKSQVLACDLDRESPAENPNGCGDAFAAGVRVAMRLYPDPQLKALVKWGNLSAAIAYCIPESNFAAIKYEILEAVVKRYLFNNSPSPTSIIRRELPTT